MPSPLTHDDPRAIGPYQPVVRLGSGGMGTVYLARGAGGRTVALKTMHARIASDPAFRTRFRLETDAARVVGERYGAGVVDADVRAETPWLATEYVLGPPLGEAVELRPAAREDGTCARRGAVRCAEYRPSRTDTASPRAGSSGSPTWPWAATTTPSSCRATASGCCPAPPCGP
ncbi:hypothetical protein GCM10010360_09490 [Streptomyces nogalater]